MSDTSPFGFGRFVPGFDFLQNLAKNASEGSKAPGLSSWIAPTLSVEDIEKRVEELKAVQFWLEQNSRALTATIQALEVQKMTLSTLKGMNVRMGDMAALFQPKTGSDSNKAAAASLPSPADAFTGVTQAMTDAMARATSAFAAPSAGPSGGAADTAPAPAEAAPAPQPPPAASGPQGQRGEGEGGAAAGDKVLGTSIDPMQWWGALTQQFQQIATNALQEVAKQASLENAAGMTQDALKGATELASQMASTGMKSVQDAQSAALGNASPQKTALARKKPAQSGTEKAAADPATEPAAELGGAAGKAPARRAGAAPSKRARG